MAKYVFNPETLTYDTPSKLELNNPIKLIFLSLLCVLLVLAYFWFYIFVLGMDLPKTAILKHRHAQLEAKVNLLNIELEKVENALYGVESRDDDVYRSIFGLFTIPKELRNSGLEGVNRYEELNSLGAGSTLKRVVQRTDALMKRVYVSSKSLDEVMQAAIQSGDMRLCIPSVPPLLPEPGAFRLTSGFGYRVDPIYGDIRRHHGQDFAGIVGTPVYATGDAVVKSVQHRSMGYGNAIVLDHGYGYQTRYAHLYSIDVKAGTKVKRGDRIGTLGNTGKSTGPHLHYEVIYMGRAVNPMNHMDLNMSVEEYTNYIIGKQEVHPGEGGLSTMDLLRRGRFVNEAR